MVLGQSPDEDMILQPEIMGQLVEFTQLKEYLLNKLIVFTCESEETRQGYLDMFRRAVAQGEQWLKTENSGSMKDDEIDRQAFQFAQN